MASARDYRQRAEEQRLAANASDLPMVRMMHKKAADRWDYIADSAERSETFAGNSSGGWQTIFT